MKYFTIQIKQKGTKALLHESVARIQPESELLPIIYQNKENVPTQQLVLKTDFKWSQVPNKDIYIGMPKLPKDKYLVLFEITEDTFHKLTECPY